MTVIDTATNTVINTVATQSVPAIPMVSPDGQRVIVPHFASNNLAIFDTATDTMIAGSPFDLGCLQPRFATFTHDSQRAYVSCYTSGVLQIVDMATGAIVGTVPGVLDASDSVLTRDGSKLLVANIETNHMLQVVDVATNTVGPSLTMPGYPASVGITPDGTIAYVADERANRVALIDIASLTEIGSIPVVGGPDGPQAHARFMGPNIVTTACAGCGPLVIAGDADLVAPGFDRFVNFNTGIISLTGDWATARTLSILAGGGTITTDGFNATINAPVINDGVLTKDGLGTLTLAGPSTHTGGTTGAGDDPGRCHRDVPAHGRHDSGQDVRGGAGQPLHDCGQRPGRHLGGRDGRHRHAPPLIGALRQAELPAPAAYATRHTWCGICASACASDALSPLTQSL